jgi:hypothetical protein
MATVTHCHPAPPPDFLRPQGHISRCTALAPLHFPFLIPVFKTFNSTIKPPLSGDNSGRCAPDFGDIPKFPFRDVNSYPKESQIFKSIFVYFHLK